MRKAQRSRRQNAAETSPDFPLTCHAGSGSWYKTICEQTHELVTDASAALQEYPDECDAMQGNRSHAGQLLHGRFGKIQGQAPFSAGNGARHRSNHGRERCLISTCERLPLQVGIFPADKTMESRDVVS